MKRTILLGSLLLMIAALISLDSMPSATGQAKKENAFESRLITVMNPAIASKFVERVPLAARANTVEGQTIFLVDLQWGGPEAAYSVFEEMKGWFARNMPSVKVEIRRSKGGWMGGDESSLDFYDLKGVLEALLAGWRIQNVSFEPVSHPTFQPGRAARLPAVRRFLPPRIRDRERLDREPDGGGPGLLPRGNPARHLLHGGRKQVSGRAPVPVVAR